MIITLTGTNNFMLETELSTLVAAFIKTHNDINLERYDGQEVDLNQLISSVSSVPFLDTRRMVVLRGGAMNKTLNERAESVVAVVNSSTDLIILEPKLDKRSSYYKILKQQTDFREYNVLPPSELIYWLTSFAKQKGGSLSAPDASYLVERIGSNQQQLVEELKKLLLYEPTITRATIDILTEPASQSSIFQLLDAVFKGNPNKTLEIYEEQRAQKVEPLVILSMIAWQLNVFNIVKTAGSRSTAEIAQEAKLNTFIIQKSQTSMRSLISADIMDITHKTLQTDVRLKSQSVDPDEEMRYLLLLIANR